jgi:uroporphyrinogen-III synthase
MTPKSLSAYKVLVTRPVAQQKALVEAIEVQGGSAFSFPLIQIDPINETTQRRILKNQIQQLDNYHVLIFISTNAVQQGAQWIHNYWPQFPVSIAVIAVGPTTAELVTAEFNCQVIHSENGMTSEDLLTLDELNEKQVKGKKIGIFRGIGGRELLANTLTGRGASVDYLEVYRRSAVEYRASELRELIRQENINVLSITSGESLNLIVQQLGDNKAEFSLLPLLVPSQRIADQAKENGFQRVINAYGASELSFIAALESLADMLE